MSGYAAAISVEPLWNLLHGQGVYPASNAGFLRAVYDSDQEADQRFLGERPMVEGDGVDIPGGS
jgi:hypothetical protein